MKHLDYRDLPLLRAAGFTPSWSGASFFGKDIDGMEWQVEEDDDGTGLLRFSNRTEGSICMTDKRFRELFSTGVV